MNREINHVVLDRLIATAEKNIEKTKELAGRIWFSRSDRLREMKQTAQALKEFREVMQERDRFRALIVEIEHQADPGRNYDDPKTGEVFISLPISVLCDIDTALKH